MGMEVVEKVLDHTENLIERDWKNVWQNGVETIKMEFLQKTYTVICNVLDSHDKQLRWVLRTHLCNFVVDKGYRDEADAGFIIQKYLDENGVKMLAELEHSNLDEAPDTSDDGFNQYNDPLAPTKEKPGEYNGFMPKDVRDEIDVQVIF